MRRDMSDLQLLFSDSVAEAILRTLDHTSAGKMKEETEEKDANKGDEWDIGQFDRVE